MSSFMKVNKNDWKHFSPAGMEKLKKAVFAHYRLCGYPYHVLTEDEKKAELCTLIEYRHENLIDGPFIRQSMHALNLSWSYHPHAVAVRCNGKRTVIETFNDDALFREVIEKRLRYDSRITDSAIRKQLSIHTGSQGVSNFRPSAASAIYHEFLPEEGGVVFDPSCGWGGRLAGAVGCRKVKGYIGCDPATQTFAGLKQMEADIKRLVPERQLETELHMLGSETQKMRDKLKPNSVGCIVWSPPYFNCEKYAEEETQSYIKFSETTVWLEQFVGQTLETCGYCLKEDGTLAINLADVDSYPNLTREFVRYAQSHGWRLTRIMQLVLSRGMGAKHKGSLKHEAVFVLRKK
jgi:tRNA G10  N-methylase Trm11